jgi:hypothetical protein
MISLAKSSPHSYSPPPLATRFRLILLLCISYSSFASSWVPPVYNHPLFYPPNAAPPIAISAMPSHLTRVVFRSILANEPLLYRGCRQRSLRTSIVTHHGARALPLSQRRTFFNFFKPARKMKPMDIPAGLEKMSDLAHAQRTAARPPPAKDIAKAFRDFFPSRKGPYEDFHITVAHNAYNYLLATPQENGEPWLAPTELLTIINLLLDPSRLPETGGEPHLQFGLALLEDIKTLQTQDPDSEVSESRTQDVDESRVSKLTILFSTFGATSKARDIALESFQFDPKASHNQKRRSTLVWLRVIQGFAREGNVEELVKTAEMMRKSSIPLTKQTHTTLVSFFAEQKDLERAKFWYSQPIASLRGNEGAKPERDAHTALLKVCALSGDLTFGHQVVASLLQDEMPDKNAWDAVFLWSAAIGKGVDEVDRIVGVMMRRNDELRKKNPAVPAIQLDADSINLLVEFSMSKQDPYSAERYIAMGEKRGIMFNEKTFVMQIQYRLSIKDLDGARAAYYNLQGEFSGARNSVAVINQLIQALCKQKQQHFDDIMAIVDDLHERKAQFAPETIAALLILHLRRTEIHDAMDLLQVHAHQFSPSQRAVIGNTLTAFIKDSESSTADAWDAYQILRNTFPETPRSDRITIMNEFFARNRSDMACHVFFHMRNHTAMTHSANREVYVAAFTGFARCTDAESLELVHNQLKLDMHVDMNTQLRNALMLAYATTGSNKKALQFWREICESKEGPSYNSIAIAFRSCEGMPWGDEHAKSIWARMKEQDVEIDKNIFIAYMSAISRNHLHDEALALIETVEEEYGFTPDLQMYVLSSSLVPSDMTHTLSLSLSLSLCKHWLTQ